MSRGVLLFANNTDTVDYVAMAEHTAKRVEHFLNLPTTIVSNEHLEHNTNHSDYNKQWFNKGRYEAYELSPYDETILLDVDYIINSDALLKLFDYDTDFVCPNKISMLMQDSDQEILSVKSFNSLWATVIMFRKTERVKQIFDCLKMIQENYQHYADIHGFDSRVFRNDYALTLAVRIVDGHLEDVSNYMKWDLVHIGKNTQVYTDNTDHTNTEYTIVFDKWRRDKIKKEYIEIKDMDFHLINKDICERIMGL